MFEVIYSRDGTEWVVYSTHDNIRQARAQACQLRLSFPTMWVKVR